MNATQSKDQQPSAWAIIVAGGDGLRARDETHAGPKQFAELGGKKLFVHALEAFALHPRIAGIVVVVPSAALEHLRVDELTAPLPQGVDVRLAAGGSSRRESVLRGLEALATHLRPPLPHILIHDAARPFVTEALIDRVLDGVSGARGVIPVREIIDTLKRSDAGLVTSGPERSSLVMAQTPQGFDGSAILDAHQDLARAIGNGAVDEHAFTDDASVLEWHGKTVIAVPGGPDNIKITTPEDWTRARYILARRDENITEDGIPLTFETRLGHGYDTHRLVPGNGVWLCGCHLPHNRALSGHSDADIGLHALTDALLGALGDGDIGTHFPPSDATWKGADSSLFIAHAVDKVAERQGRIVNVDVTIIAEAPKIGPHREAMVRKLAELLRIEADRVSIKATTNETMGFVGRSEGLAAIATASVALPVHG